MAKTLEEYKTEVTAEVESQKPMMILNSDGSESEMTDSDYEWYINVTSQGRYDIEQKGYIEKRQAEYGGIGDQLDMLYKDIDGAKLNKNGSFYKHVKKVKEDNPKPE